MNSRILRALSATAVAASLSLACIAAAPVKARPVAKPASSKLVVPKIPFEKYTLPNGLEVILSEDHTLPLVSVNVWYHVGAANEHQGLTGFAHLFEHMMFEGSGNVGPRKHFKYVESAGGSLNGSTSFDRTNYFETLPSNQLALGLWLESDRMGFLLDTLDREKLTNQRDVVRNERRQTHENRPYGVSEEVLYHTIFPPTHPYYAEIIGSHADIEAARLGDVRNFFKQFYTPNNATLTIVGDFKKEEAKAQIEKYFGPLQRGPAKPALNVPMPQITSERRVTVTDTVQLPAVTIAWLTPPGMAPGDAELDIAQLALGGGRTSRLYQELVYKQQIAQSASCDHDSQALASIFSCDIIARPNVKPEQVEAAAEKIIDEFLASGPTVEEMKRAKIRIQDNMIRPLERVGSVADLLQQYNQETGDPGYLQKDLARYDAVTADGVKQNAVKFLSTSSRVVVTTVAGEKKLQDVPRSPEDTDKDFKITPEYSPEFMASQAFRKTAPLPGPTPKLNLPVATSFTLPNGLKVLVTERHKLPLVSASLITLAGSASDSPSKPGVSGFTANMLREGTTTRTSTDLSNATADIGASINASASTDYSMASLSSLSTTTDEAMDLFADVTLHPSFDSQEIARVRGRLKTSLLQSRDSPMAIAGRVAKRALFGADSPLAYTSQGTPDSVTAITREDMTTFYNTHYGPKNAALVFAGDITVAQARALATRYFGKWSSNAVQTPVLPAKAATSHKVLIVDKPGAPQTAVYAMELGVPRSTPDFPSLEVMNAPLGGLFSSRINQNLREAHGYTYGAQTAFQYYRGTGLFLAASSVRTDVTVPAVKELMGELKRIETDPLTDAELKMGKDSVIRSLPGEFQTNGSMAGAMASIYIYSLPLDYFARLPLEYEAVTSDQARKAAEVHIHPEQFIVVAVGDKAKIESGLKDLNLGPVEEWTQDGEPKK